MKSRMIAAPEASQSHHAQFRTTAIVVGTLFIIATITYSLGNGIIESFLSSPDYLVRVQANQDLLVAGVLIGYVAAAANVFIGVLLFPVLRRHSERVALGYLATRIFDGVGLVASGLGILALRAVSQHAIQAGTVSDPHSLALGNLLISGSSIAFDVTMAALGIGAIPFSYLLYRARLIPRPMAALGVVSYLALLVGSLLELFGLNLMMIHFAPGAVFELVFPLWLIVKGFNSPTTSVHVPQRTTGEASIRVPATAT